MGSNARSTFYVIGALAASALSLMATKKAIDAYRDADLTAAMFPGGPEAARELRRKCAGISASHSIKDGVPACIFDVMLRFLKPLKRRTCLAERLYVFVFIGLIYISPF